MSSVLERSLGILELLSEATGGLSLNTIASRLDMPGSATHRLLNELVRFGYVRQDKVFGDYLLTMKLVALGLSFVGRSGLTDIAQPILDELALVSRELVRLAVVDSGSLIWVAVAQGATSGLRYDPGREQGVVAHLSSTAGGHAFLSTLDDNEALMRVAEQDLKMKAPAGAKPPTSTELLRMLDATRKRGYSIANETYIIGMAAMAIPILHPNSGAAIGTVSIAGPTARLSEARMKELSAPLRAAANDLAKASVASSFFGRFRTLQQEAPSTETAFG